MRLIAVIITIALCGCASTYAVQKKEVEDAYRDKKITYAEYLQLKATYTTAENAEYEAFMASQMKK